MNELYAPQKLKFSYTVYAVMFGSDEIECPLRCKKISFQLCSEKCLLGATVSGMNFNEIIPMSESSMVTKAISKLHCDTVLAEQINRRLPLIPFPFSALLLNTCHVFYDLSYHQNNGVSITLLTIAREMLYLENE